MQFVPPESLGEKAPCRHIPLSKAGETLNDLYWGGTQQEIEVALGSWLRKTIARLEAERAVLSKGSIREAAKAGQVQTAS